MITDEEDDGDERRAGVLAFRLEELGALSLPELALRFALSDEKTMRSPRSWSR